MPTATDCLETADAVPDEYRMPTDEYEPLGDDHYQYAWPAVQVGRLRNEVKNHYVYDPHRGPVATIRANMFKAEGPGKNTGLILDERGPRRITPTECARIHGFNTNPIRHLTPHQLYSIIGNSVTVHMAHAYLKYFDRVLRFRRRSTSSFWAGHTNGRRPRSRRRSTGTEPTATPHTRQRTPCRPTTRDGLHKRSPSTSGWRGCHGQT